MATGHASKSADVRKRIGHPIIDTDGHFLELNPVLMEGLWEHIRQIGGSRMAEKFEAAGDPTHDRLVLDRWYRKSEAERRDTWDTCPAWWVMPTRNTMDRATASLPRLLYERMDELGIDFAIQYPSNSLTIRSLEDEELRRVGCRALNSFHAEIYHPYADRMTPAAIIPMNTPEEAVDEVEYAVGTLGLKVVTTGHVLRPVPKVQREHPEASRYARRLDTLGIDSDYDYDPLWAKCVERKVAATFHSGGRGWGSRQSISNFSYNHIGHFAAGGEAICKSLFMGGVTKRFPTLKFAFLEGGVGWACSLYNGIIGEWERRNPAALRQLDPAKLDHPLIMRLAGEYGDSKVGAKLEELSAFFHEGLAAPHVGDDWAACGMEHAKQIRDLFVPNFYFGCEADDPTMAWAFNSKVNPFGARLQAVLGSDIGHYDVPDITRIVEEAYEMVERGLFTEHDFRDLTFANPVGLHAGMNPDFFNGTVVERDVAGLVGGASR